MSCSLKNIEHGIETGVKKAANNVAGVLTGGGDWNTLRNAAETGAVLAGNYELPGSSLATSHLVSKGSQKQLSSPLGTAAQIGTGLTGAGVGSSVTGIPSAAAAGAGWSNLASGIGNAASSVGDALGLTDAATTAAPWVNPDLASVAGTGGTAAPWVNPDIATAPGASAGGAAPWVNPDVTNFDALGNPVNVAGTDASPNLTGGDVNFLNKAGMDVTGNSINPTSSIAHAVAPTAEGTASSLWKSVAPAISPAISGTGLALSLLKGEQKLPQETALNTQAAQNASEAEQLKNYLPSGTLPPGAQAGIDQAKNSAKAAIRSKYASMGMSGSSSEQQELAAADERAQAQGEQEALSLLNSGIQESQLSSELYQNILNNTLQQDQNLSSAIGNFASSIGGAVNKGTS